MSNANNVGNCCICNGEGSVAIPGTTRTFYFCMLCILTRKQLPASAVTELVREFSVDMVMLLLSQIADKEELWSKLLFQEQKTREIEEATQYNILDSLRKDRDRLTDDVMSLSEQLARKEQERKELEAEIKTSSTMKDELNKFLTTYFDAAIERLVTSVKKNTVTSQQAQRDIMDAFAGISDQLRRMETGNMRNVDMMRRKPRMAQPDTASEDKAEREEPVEPEEPVDVYRYNEHNEHNEHDINNHPNPHSNKNVDANVDDNDSKDGKDGNDGNDGKPGKHKKSEKRSKFNEKEITLQELESSTE